MDDENYDLTDTEQDFDYSDEPVHHLNIDEIIMSGGNPDAPRNRGNQSRGRGNQQGGRGQQPQGQPQQQYSGQGQSGNGLKPHCDFCGRDNHTEDRCYQKKKQGQQAGPSNANANQNGKGRRNSQNDNGNRNGRVDGSQTQPHDDCYMHPDKGHNNIDCKSKSNWHNPGNNNNNSQPQPQFQQRSQPQQSRPQQSRPKINRDGPLAGAGFNYCERCNVIGHDLIDCAAPPYGARKMLTCRLCANHGHTHTQCRHPGICSLCKTRGHSKESCRNPTADASLFEDRMSEYLPVVDAPSLYVNEHGKMVSPPHCVHHAAPQAVFPTPTPRSCGVTKAYFANGKGDIVLEAPLDEVSEQIAAIAAEKEAARRQAIATKCVSAHTMYSMQLLNEQILSGALFFGRVDPGDPQIQLPRNVHKTAALERLCQFWINDDSFGLAAAFVRKGWNFFRDPRVLDAIARASSPVCHCCSSKGRILSATFTELLPGTDVLAVEDYDLWGPSVMFKCQCCLDGYSFLHAEDGGMDVSL